jgi:hypothetical protein
MFIPDETFRTLVPMFVPTEQSAEKEEDNWFYSVTYLHSIDVQYLHTRKLRRKERSRYELRE